MSSYSYLKEFITPRDSWMVGLIKKTPHEDKLLQSLKALNSPLQAIWKLKEGDPRPRLSFTSCRRLYDQLFVLVPSSELSKVKSMLTSSQNYESAKELVTKGIPDFANIYHSLIKEILQETSVKGLLEYLNEERCLIECSTRDDVTIDNCENLAKELMYGFIKEDKHEKLDNLFKQLIQHYATKDRSLITIRALLKTFLTSKYTFNKEDQIACITPKSTHTPSSISSSTPTLSMLFMPTPSSTSLSSSIPSPTSTSTSKPTLPDQNQEEAPGCSGSETKTNQTLRDMFCLCSCCKRSPETENSEDEGIPMENIAADRKKEVQLYDMILHHTVSVRAIQCVDVVLRYAYISDVNLQMLDQIDEFQMTPLHLAVLNLDSQMTCKLILEGAHVFSRSETGNEHPLNLAVKYLPNILPLLLDLGITYNGDLHSSRALTVVVDFNTKKKSKCAKSYNDRKKIILTSAYQMIGEDQLELDEKEEDDLDTYEVVQDEQTFFPLTSEDTEWGKSSFLGRRVSSAGDAAEVCFNENGADSTPKSAPIPRTYVGNVYNRSMSHVGRRYVDNVYNRRGTPAHVGLPLPFKGQAVQRTVDESTSIDTSTGSSTSLEIRAASQSDSGEDTKPGETDRFLQADSFPGRKWENDGLSTKESSSKTTRPKQYGNQMHTLAYYALVQRKQFEELARHPVLQLFLERKWNQMKYNAFILNFLPMIILHCIYIVGMYLVYYIDCPKTAGPTGNQIMIELKLATYIMLLLWAVFLPVAALIDIGFSIWFLRKLKISKSHWQSMFSFQGYKIIFRAGFYFVGMITLVLPLINKEMQPYFYIFAVIGVIYSGSFILSLLGDLNISFWIHSIYIHTYIRVLKRFSSVMLTFSPLLISLVVSFNICFPNSTQLGQFFTTILRASVMMLGEFNFDDFNQVNSTTATTTINNTASTSSDRQDYLDHYHYFGLIVIAVFSVFITLILADVFLGYTVSDINEIKSKSESMKMSNQVVQLFLLEEVHNLGSCCSLARSVLEAGVILRSFSREHRRTSMALKDVKPLARRTAIHQILSQDTVQF